MYLIQISVRVLFSILLVGIFSQSTLAARPNSQDVAAYDALFNALEQRTPQAFPSHQTSQWLDGPEDSAYLRVYDAAQTLIAVYRDVLYYLGPLSGGQLLPLGPVKGSGGWLEVSGVSTVTTSTSGGLDVSKLTANAWYAGAGGTYGYCSGGVCSDSGAGQYYQFNADGSYVGAYRTQDSCTGQVTTMSGRYTISGTTVTFTELSRHAQLITSCSGSLGPVVNENPSPAYRYDAGFTATDGAGNRPPSGTVFLYLADRSRNVGSYFRASTQ